MLSPSRVRWSARPGSLDPEGLESTVITEQAEWRETAGITRLTVDSDGEADRYQQ